jgi:RNA polymerase sigma-70 factor (ECF subfamily)
MAKHSLGATMAHSRNGHGAVSEEPSPVSKQQHENVDAPAKNRDTILPASIAKVDFKKLTIRELLECLLETNNPDAWMAFQDRIKRNVRGTVSNTLGQSRRDELIDELEQDTYAKLIANNYGRLRDKIWPNENSIFGFVRVTAAHVVVDYLRKSENKIFFNSEELDGITERSANDQTPVSKLMLAEIEKCLEAWAHEKDFERDRAIFWYFFRWGYTAREIAEMPRINLSIKKVENILQKMTSRLRAKLRKPGRGATPE